jgi:hypothetical protein
MKSLCSMLLGAVLLLGASRTLPAAAVASPAHLIYAGWFGNTIPTPGFVAANRSFLETRPFSGLAVYLRNDSTLFNATQNVLSTTSVSYSALSTLLTPIRGVTFSKLTQNFGLIQTPKLPDFFDDWTVAIQNCGNLARAIKEAGLKGVFLDNESYGRNWGNYPEGAKYPNRTLAQYQVQARLRGKQCMEAMAAQFPNIAVLSLHGPYVSEPKVPEPLFPLWYMANELLGPFSVGFLEGSSTALNIDGGELYRLRTADEFLRSYNWRKYTLPSDTINCAFIPPAIRPAWPGRISIGFGIYDQTFGVSMNSTIARTTIANALRHSDHYSWFYTEGPTFLLPTSQGGASTAWVDAVRLGVQDAGGTPAPAPPPPPAGTGPAAPSHFVASHTSSSAIDLSWWDMSNNESSFEIERKTGSAGTWSRVLTTGANVSTIDDIGLSAGTFYVYRVRAVNSSGASAWSTEDGATTSAAAPTGPVPAAPTHMSVRSYSGSTISVTWWDMSNNETGFEVERKTGSGGTWARIATKGANISIHDDAGRSAGTTYYYRVRSVNGSGPSAWSNEISARLP